MFSSTWQWLHQYIQQWLFFPVLNWEWMLDKYFGKKVIEHYNSKLIEEILPQWEISQVLQQILSDFDWMNFNHIGLGI